MPKKKKAASPKAPPIVPSPLPHWDRELTDKVVINKCAETPQELRQTLDHAVNNTWSAEDITMIRRVESEKRCMWVMWRRKTLPPA